MEMMKKDVVSSEEFRLGFECPVGRLPVVSKPSDLMFPVVVVFDGNHHWAVYAEDSVEYTDFDGCKKWAYTGMVKTLETKSEDNLVGAEW